MSSIQSAEDAIPRKRWHSVKLEKISTESRHLAWDSGKYNGWCWRAMIGFWIVGFTLSHLGTDRHYSFWIGDLTRGR